jgi:hypothetical protein
MPSWPSCMPHFVGSLFRSRASRKVRITVYAIAPYYHYVSTFSQTSYDIALYDIFLASTLRGIDWAFEIAYFIASLHFIFDIAALLKYWFHYAITLLISAGHSALAELPRRQQLEWRILLSRSRRHTNTTSFEFVCAESFHFDKISLPYASHTWSIYFRVTRLLYYRHYYLIFHIFISYMAWDYLWLIGSEAFITLA